MDKNMRELKLNDALRSQKSTQAARGMTTPIYQKYTGSNANTKQLNNKMYKRKYTDRDNPFFHVD